MKNIRLFQLILTCILSLGIIYFSYSQSAGFNSTFAILSINGGANAYYDLNATTVNADFNGANLGTFNPASNSLTLRGAEHNVWRCGGSDLTSTRLMYRIYSTSASGGAFTSLNVPYTSGGNNGCGGQDQQWSLTGHNLNVLSGLAPGSYFLEVYSEATVTNCCGGMVYAGNGGANYKATFTVGGSPVVVTATNGNVGPTVYATLGAAFTAINAGTHTGTINVRITGNTTETATCTLNASGSGSASYTAISIQPAGGGARTVSGAIAAGSPLIDLNGADNVTIDGLNTGGNSLTISNSTVGSTFTIRFIGDAIGNTITNCSVLGSSTGTATTNSGTIFFSTSTTNGNDNNTISNCNIGPVGSNLPSKAIYSNGSTTNATRANSGISITGNNIYDYYLSGAHAAIYANDGNTDWTISNNKFYQTATRTFSASTGSAIFINGSTTANNNNLISGNTIGFANSSGTGTYTLVFVSGSSFIPINIAAAGTSTATSVQGNTIAGIAISGAGSGTSTSAPFRAIYVGGGLTTIGNVTGNIIGSLSTTGSITYTSSSTSASDVIGMFNFGSSAWTTNNNNIGSITVANSSTGATNFYGLRCNTGSAVTWTCTGNTIGGTIANSISSTSTATGTIVNGILNSNPIGTFTSNVIRNMTVAGGTGTTTTASIVGICMNSTANQTISQNQIFNLSNTNTTAATVVTGIQFTGGSTNIVERNFIYGLTSSTNSASAEVNGIRVAGGTTTYRNNMIAIGTGITNALGATASNTGQTGINGFNGALGTDNFWNNSVYIGGTATAGTGASYAFNGTQTTNTRSFRNNIFFNARTNSGATGKHYAIKINGAPNPTGLTLNNNIYFTSGTGGVFGFCSGADVANLAAWQTAMGSNGYDGASFSSNPQFVDPTAAVPDLHINPNVSSNADGSGVDLGVTTDFDGQTRSGLSPVDIGADAYIANVSCSSSPTSPTNAASNVSQTTSLTWAAATNATSYDVFLGTDNPPTNVANGTNITSTTFTPSSALNPSTTYFWRIVPKNAGSTASGCTVWSFTTQAAVPTLSAVQPSLSFGNLCVNSNTTSTFTMNAVNLTGASVTISAPSGYTVSEDNVTFASSITVNHTSGAFSSKTIHVRFSPVASASYSGNVVISGGGLSADVNVSVSGTGTGLSGTYTVGSGGNYSTLTAAVAAYNSTCLYGPVVFNLTDATYSTSETFPITINANASASATNTLTIKPATGVSSTISGNSSSSIITLNGADFIIIDGSNNGSSSRNLTINNSNPGTNSAVLWLQNATTDGSTNNVLKNNIVRGNGPATSLFGIGMGNSTISTSSLGSGNNSNSILNNDIGACQHGVYTQGASAASKNTGNSISSNVINNVTPNNVGRTGILTGFENNLTIDRNILGEINGPFDRAAINLGWGTSYSGVTTTGNEVTNASITNNTITGVVGSGANTSFGICVASASSGTTLISNNMISGVSHNSTSPDIAAGIAVGGGAGSTTNVYFNTVSMQGVMTGSTAGAMASTCFAVTNATMGTINVRNNIFSNTQIGNTSSTTRFSAIGLTASTLTGFSSNYNNLISSGSGPGTYVLASTGGITGGTTYTFASWQTSLAQDANSMNINPPFVSATDLHINSGLTQTQLESGGIAISGLTTDIDGQTRPGPSGSANGGGTAPDIGADEFDGVPLPQCVTPSVQASAVTITNLSATSSTVSFTAGNGASYLVVTATGAAPSNPVDGTTYALNSVALGSGTTVVGNGAATTYNLTGLTAGQAYTVYVYTYNNTNCLNGPDYATPAATVSFTTCAATIGTAPVSAAATNATPNSFTANWSAVSGWTPTNYVLDVATDAGFTTLVSGYNALNVGNVTSFNVTGLNGLVTYHFRVRATDGNCITPNSVTRSVFLPTLLPLIEGFNNSTIPNAWSTSIVSVQTATKISYVTSATDETASPSEGNRFVRYNSFSSSGGGTGSQERLITPPFYTIGVNDVTIYFDWFESSNSAYTNTNEGLTVQYSIDGTTWTSIGSSFPRYVSTAPANGGWSTKMITLPSGGLNQNQLFVSFMFTSAWGYNCYLDKINILSPCVAPAQPTNLTFTNVGPSQMTVNYTAPSPAPSAYMIVRYPTGDSPTSPSNGTTYTAGNTLGTGTVAYVGTGVSNVISGLAPNTTYDFYIYPYNAVTCTNGPVYNTTNPITGSQSTTGCPTLSSLITIGPGFDYTNLTDAIIILNGCGITQPTVLELQSNYVSTSETFPISLGTISGTSATNTITIRPAADVSSALAITSSNSTGTISHNQGSYFIFDGRPGGAGTNKFITIENTSTSGYAVNYQNESSNNALLYLTLKSQNTSTSSGTIVISSTTGANGNDNNTIEYNDICAVNASSATPTNAIYAAGSTATSASNNSNNVVSNNTIRDFYNSTSTTNGGSGVYIVTGNTDWTISNNSIFQTQTRSTFGAAAPFYAIFINNTSGNNFNVSSNTIGGTAINAGGSALTINASTTALMRLVYLSVGTTTATNVSSNTIKNISFTTTSTSTVNSLISILNGAVNCTNNILGDASVSNSIVFNTSGASAMFSGISAGTGGTGQGAINITGNIIAGIAVGGGGTCELRGISFQSSGITASTQYTVSNNIIGSTSITNSLSNSNNSAIYGIIGTASQTTSTNAISANTIAGIQSTSTGVNASVYGVLAQGNSGGKYNTNGNSISKLQSSGGSIVSGIYHTAATTNDQVIGANNVSELAHTGTGTASVLGIYYSGPIAGTNEIKSNLVHSLSAATAGSTITGIQVADAGNAIIYNNMIRLGINAAGSTVTTNALVYGINQSGATSNHSIYFNSIYVGGTGVSTGANNTFALHSAATSGTRNIRNNIFSNERANGAGTGKHYGIRVAGFTGLTINNNDYWTGASFLALNNATDVTAFASWQTATSQDAGSLSNDPNFVNPTGSSSTLDLHINNATSSVLESGGVNVPGITTDIDGNTRPGPSGSSNGGGISSDIGADEFDGIPGYTCSTFPALTAVTTNANVCGGTTATLSITGTIAGTGVTYQWQSSSTQTGTYTNIVGATGATYVVPVSSVSNLWYICQVTCANGPLTSTTSSVNVQVSACNYTTSRNTGITYSSIMNTGLTYSTLNGTTPADDGYTNVVSLSGTTFKYRGSAVTGFVATTNGWMTFNTTSTSNAWTNDLTNNSNFNVLAPMWEDLVIRGTDIANKDISMRYQIIGTLGSGTADIVIEWAEMERFQYGDPNVNFQVVLHESDNSIDFNYGNFQMFNGATNPSTTTWTYSIGMNGPTPATNSTDQRIILQAENSNFFSSASQNSLGYSIECNSQFRFVPSLAFSSGSAPTSGSYTASTFVPSNNETAGAITLPVNGSPCVSYCGIIYSSKNATASSGISACSAPSPGTADDDVFFKFNTSTLTNYRIAVDPSAGYNAVVQVLDASLSPVTCVNAAGAGLSELITSVALNPSSLYYIRVYDAATGATNNGEFSICVSEVIAPPVNDEPSGAIALTSGTTCSGTSSILPATLSATATNGVTSCSAGTPGTADDDIWYTFTTNSIAGTTYAITATGVSTYNAVLQLYSGTIGNLVSVNCVNATGNGGVETINAGALSTNTTYFIRVYHSGTGAANGNVSICVVHTLPSCLTSATNSVNDYVWQGQSTDWNASSNWLIYNGPSSYTVANSAPSSVNVVIPSSTCFSNQPVVVTAPSVVNNLTVLSGATLNLGSNILDVSGNFTISGTFNSGTGGINFIGNGTQIISMGAQTFNNVSININDIPNIEPIVQLASNTTINGDYINNSGSLDLNSFNLTIGGNYSNYVASTGTLAGLIPNGGSIIFNKATGTQTLDQAPGVDFFTVRHTGAGTLQLLSDISTTGNIVNNAGTFDGNGKVITIKGNFNNTATFDAGSGGQIIFEKDGGNQTLTAGTSVFGKLIHQIPTGGTSSTLTLSGTVEVIGDIVIDAPIIAGTSTVKLSGTTNQIISGSENIIPLKDMTIAKSSGVVTISKSVRVDGSLTMTQGDIITNASSILEIGSSATSTGSVSWSSGTVRGPMKRWFAANSNSNQSSGIFPVGADIPSKGVINRYAQVNFTSAPEGGYIIASYVTGTPSTGYSGLPITYNTNQYIQNYEEEGYWDITPYDANGIAYGALNSAPYTLKLRMNNPSTLQAGLPPSGSNGNTVADISKIRIITSKGPSHNTWVLAGTQGSGHSVLATGDYLLEETGVTGFSFFNGGGNDNNPLPIELNYFSGACNNELVTLSWQTASEQNTSHFDIEKSTDGENWNKIGTVNASGNSTQEINYTFIDSEKSNGDNYYRLNQVDVDGKNEYFGPITVSCEDDSKINTYPNPSKGEFNLVMHAKTNEQITLKITDGNSRILSTKVLDLQNGINLFPIRENLSSGVYHIQLISESGKTTVLKHSVY
jgi:hypothetical protein